MLPYWRWLKVFNLIEDAEKGIKREEEEEGDSELDFDSWQLEAERENAEIDEMFGAMRYS